MNEPGISQQLAKELSLDNTFEIKKVSDEIVKASPELSAIQGIFCQVIQILCEKIGPEESLDSFGDVAITNYFYLIASSKEYEEFFGDFEKSIPVDYESVLYKAIELEDGPTIQHLIHKKPELLNLKLRSFFTRKNMKDFLLNLGWGEDFNQGVREIKIQSKEEPAQSIEEPRFEEVKNCVSQTVRRKAA